MYCLLKPDCLTFDRMNKFQKSLIPIEINKHQINFESPLKNVTNFQTIYQGCVYFRGKHGWIFISINDGQYSEFEIQNIDDIKQ